MARPPSERFDVFGQDTWTHPDEEQHAADMGQPSTVPREHHGPVWTGAGVADDFGPPSEDMVVFRTPADTEEHHAAVLCQTPVFCGKCGRQTRPFEDVLVMVDGEFWHDECVQS